MIIFLFFVLDCEWSNYLEYGFLMLIIICLTAMWQFTDWNDIVKILVLLLNCWKWHNVRVKMCHWFFDCWNVMQICLRGRLRRSDRLRLGRPASTSSAQREKQALHPPMAGRGRGRGRLRGIGLARVDAAGASSSQTGLSQTVDPTQYQQQHYQE